MSLSIRVHIAYHKSHLRPFNILGRSECEASYVSLAKKTREKMSKFWGFLILVVWGHFVASQERWTPQVRALALIEPRAGFDDFKDQVNSTQVYDRTLNPAAFARLLMIGGSINFFVSTGWISSCKN